MATTIADTMYKLLLSKNRTSIWYGDIDIIEECANLCNVKKSHPQKTITCVLNALDQSSKFKKGYIHADFNGTTRKYRCFTIINLNQ